MRTSNPEFEPGTLNPHVLRPIEVVGGDRLGYKIVAVVDEATHTWRAYLGPTSWTDEQVQANGDSLTESQAHAMFPVLVHTGRRFEV